MILAQTALLASRTKLKTQAWADVSYAIEDSTKKTEAWAGEKKASSNPGAGKLDVHMQKNEAAPLSVSLHKSWLRWTRDADVKPETPRRLETGHRCGKALSKQDSSCSRVKTNNGRVGLRKRKKFPHTPNETINWVKRKSTEWERIFASYTPNRRLIGRIYKKFKKQRVKKTSDPIKKWNRDLNKNSQ